MEIGAGTGRITKIINEVTKRPVHVLDKDKDFLDRLQKDCSGFVDNECIHLGDLHNIDKIFDQNFRNAFDTVVIVGTA